MVWPAGGIKKDMEQRGYEGCKYILSLEHHAFERRDVTTDQFIKRLLNEEDFAAWQHKSADYQLEMTG